MNDPFPVLTPASRHSDPETSRLAERIMNATGLRADHQRRLLVAVRQDPGLTSRQLARETGIEYHEVARRLPEVETAHLIKKGPAVACPISGNRAVTWWPR